MTLQLQQALPIISITGDVEISPQPTQQVILSHGKLLPISALNPDPYMQVMSANGPLTGPVVKCTGGMTAITLIDPNIYRVQIVYNAGTSPINPTPFAGTSILGLAIIAVGSIAKFVTLQGGTQVQQFPS